MFIGDDWAEDHHDIEIEDDQGRRLAKARLPEGPTGIGELHALISRHAPPEWAELDSDDTAAHVLIGIETDRGPWVTARCRLPGVCDQSAVLGPLSRAAFYVWSQE